MSNCTCGRTTRPPLCDGSHQMSEEAYKERSERLNKLFKERKNNVQTTIQPNNKDRLSKS